MSITNSPQENNRKAKPNRWAKKQMWRRKDNFDTYDAEEARRALVNLNFYLMRKIDDDHAFDIMEANERHALHQIVDELDCNDLFAAFRFCRVLLLCPEGLDAAFELVKIKAARFNAWYEEQKKLKVTPQATKKVTDELDYLKLLDEIPGEDIHEPNYLDLLGDEA